MKKIIAVLILTAVSIMASVSSFAVNLPKETRSSSVVYPPVSKGDKTKPSQEVKALNAQIRDLEKQVEQNSRKLNRLKNQSKKACAAAKTRLMALQRHKNTLTKDQIDALIEDIKLLKQYNDELNGMKTDISAEVQNLNDAKTQNKLDLVIQILNQIIKSQNERITRFQEIIDGLNHIAVV